MLQQRDEPVGVLVVDDSAIFRKILSTIIQNHKGMKVLGVAENGREALEKIASLRPSLVTLDLEMPVMGGIGVLQELRSHPNPPTTVIVSSQDPSSAGLTMKALELNAFDFICKHRCSEPSKALQCMKEQLDYILSSFQERGKARDVDLEICKSEESPFQVPEVIVMGASTGGPSALRSIFSQIPPSFSTPIFVVQHIVPGFTTALAENLNHHTSLTVKEAEDEELVCGGGIYIAPGGVHMKIAAVSEGVRIHLKEGPPEEKSCPSINHLFSSAADMFGSKAWGVILTGMGKDGVEGMRAMKRQGAHLIAQDKKSCSVFGLPRIAIQEGLVDRILDLEELGQALFALKG